MDALVIAGSVLIGLLIGYSWGYDIGYWDADKDKAS